MALRRNLSTALLSAALIVGSQGAASAAIDDGDQAPGATVADIGPDSGLVVIEDEVAVGSGTKASRRMTGASPAGLVNTTTFWWGSSYAKSTERLQLTYNGRAYAAGNLYNGKRVVKVCVTYRRNGVDLHPWVCSYARSTGQAWLPGEENSITLPDSLNPNAPTTYFRKSVTLIDPNVF